MIEMRHVGLYVENLEQMEEFYATVFSMKKVLSKVKTSDILIDAIVGKGATVLISKLVTPYGCQTGTGDMVELLQVVTPATPLEPGPVYTPGRAHIGFGVDDLDKTVETLIQHGGVQQTPILQMGKNRCCFCTDPEHNWLELIQRG